MTIEGIESLLSGTYARLGRAEETFECCDTGFSIHATGRGASDAVADARRTARDLESQLDAFDERSAVARLNRDGVVENRHVARLVRRGLGYAERTGGVFDVRQGRVERELKAYLRGDSAQLPSSFDDGEVSVDGATVSTDVPLDLNGLAKGYIVDRAAAALSGVGRTGFVDGGGDIAGPTGPVAVESPHGDGRPLRVLETGWNVATSGGYRRNRGSVNHVYDPTRERLGTDHDLVTVVAERDCMEADALATALSAMAVDEALDVATDWDGVEAFVVHGGVFRQTEGFDAHVAS